MPIFPIPEIDFLLRRKFPHYVLTLRKAGVAGPHTAAGKEIVQIEQYAAELQALPAAERRALYEAEMAKERNERATREQVEELGRFFHQPSANADFEHWSKAAYWTLEEATALSFGKDPRIVHWSSLKDYDRVSPFVKRYAGVRDLASRAARAKELFDHDPPGAFVAWARRNEIDFPAALEEKLAAHGQRATDWKQLYERLKTAFEEHAAAARSTITGKDAAIAAVRAELESSWRRIGELEKKAGEPSLGTRERETLLKLAIGMALAGYKFDPKAAKNAATKEIADDLVRLGIPLDQDTVRKWLKQAAELLPPGEG